VLRILKVPGSNIGGRPVLLTAVFRQYIPPNIGTVPQMMSRLTSYTSIPIHYSLPFPSLDAEYSKLLTDEFNNLF
jgi:hypothetical protein